MKHQIFIGSSSEGLHIAYSLQNNLENAANITVWTQDVFQPSEYILESLLKTLNLTDLGILVFSPDDVVRIRGVEYAATRDNVIFEFGLFVGHLGRDQSIIVAPKGENPRLPSDLLGVNVLKYESEREDKNWDAALGPASNKIRNLLGEIQPKANSLPAEFKLSILERRDLLTAKQRAILTEIERRNTCSVTELTTMFPTMPIAELTYRLEQLRLLMFISSRDIDMEYDQYTLSEYYRHALRNRIKAFRT